jgi:predicted PurR-regulated permease PerM
MRYRNFTGDDLVSAENDMRNAWNMYLNAQEAYNYSLSVGHDRYARKTRKPAMDTAKSVYDAAKNKYDDILESISQINNLDFQSQQQNFISETLQTETSGAEKPAYSTIIYIAIAFVLAYFILK